MSEEVVYPSNWKQTHDIQHLKKKNLHRFLDANTVEVQLQKGGGSFIIDANAIDIIKVSKETFIWMATENLVKYSKSKQQLLFDLAGIEVDGLWWVDATYLDGNRRNLRFANIIRESCNDGWVPLPRRAIRARSPNLHKIEDGVLKILLQPDDKILMIDEEDMNKVLHLTNNIYYQHQGYAQVRIKTKEVAFHRWLLDLSEYNQANPEQVDHINGDTLDCRRINLRVVTKQENMMNKRMAITNTSGINGVHENKLRYTVAYKINGKRKSKCFGFGPWSTLTKEEAWEAARLFKSEQDARSGSTNGIRPKRQRID